MESFSHPLDSASGPAGGNSVPYGKAIVHSAGEMERRKNDSPAGRQFSLLFFEIGNASGYSRECR
jgi:hypothetical protein